MVTGPEKGVYQGPNGALVAGNELGGEDHHVPRTDHHLLVLAGGDAHQGGVGFPLAAGGQNNSEVVAARH